MDINPFDQFAGEFNASLPQLPPSEQSNALAPPQFNLTPQPKQPVMNNGQMAPYGQPNNNGGQMQSYGASGPMQPYRGQPGMNQLAMNNNGSSAMMMPSQSGFSNNSMTTAPANSLGFGSSIGPGALVASSVQSTSQSITRGGFSNNSMTTAPANSLGFGSSIGPGALVASSVQSNPYALGPPQSGDGAAPSMPPQQLGYGQPPPQLGYGQQQPQLGAPPQPQQQGYGQPLHFQQQPSSNAMNPFGAQRSIGASPQPQQSQMYYEQTKQPQLAMDPFAAPAPSQAMVPADPWSGGSIVPAPPVPQQQPNMPPPQIASDPWGAPTQQSSSALVPSSAVNDDPFGIFGSAPPAAAAPAPQPAPQLAFEQQPAPALHNSMTSSMMSAPPPQPPANIDPWAEMGFGSEPSPAPAPAPFLDDEGDLFDGGIGAAAARAQREATMAFSHVAESQPKPVPTPSKSQRTKGELPPGGEWYDAKIFTPTLGVMFFKPKELVDSLFLQTDKSTVEALEDRPIVAFIVEGSSARSAGVELGHVLLKVNGIDVKNPKEASRLIKEGPRPLPLLFYVPNTQVVVAEGEHMVKYNTKETSAPNSAKDWKPKYVVIGGIIAQPWMMNMYRSKSEYDIAVIETQARRPISVKVKQFSLQGARIQNDWQGPQMVKYKNKLHPWKYIVVLPVSRNPIKIASPNLSQLKPVHEGIRRVLNAQQSRSGGGGGGPSALPVPVPVRRDEYDRGGGPSAQPVPVRRDEYDRGTSGYNGRSGY